MFRSIVVPLDGSRFAEGAVPLARLIAERSRGALEFLLVHQSIIPGGIPEGFASYAESARRAEREYLQEAVERLVPAGVPEVSTTFLEGKPARALADYVVDHHPDLVVMTTHGRGPVSRVWLGSVTDQMMRAVPTPMLILRPDPDDPAAAPRPTPKRIVVALDRSGFAEAVLEPAGAMAALFDAELELLHVVHPPLPMGEPPVPYLVGFDEELAAQLVSQAEAYLGAVAGKLRGKSLAVVTCVLPGGDTAAAILGHAADVKADMIAVATHGESGVRRLMLGSVTDKVVRGSTVPILIAAPAAHHVARRDA